MTGKPIQPRIVRAVSLNLYPFVETPDRTYGKG